MAKRKKRSRKKNKRKVIRMRETHSLSRAVGNVPSHPQGASSGTGWAGTDGPIGAYVRNESKKTLEAYRSQPNLIDEHANHEEDTARGGYAHRQLFELVQNGADALSESGGGRIWIGLNSTHLYCADNGKAIDPDGVRALMFSYLSPKRGTAEIGRFGLGFKSVLGVTDAPEFFSRSGSFRFNRDRAAQIMQPIAPTAGRYPVLRLAEALDPWPVADADPVLRGLMDWAVNIVRLPLKADSHAHIDKQMEEFPAEFLLFVEHVKELVLLTDQRTDQQEAARTITLSKNEGYWNLDDSGITSRWMLSKTIHRLSPDARSDSRALDNAEEVPITWAAPVENLTEPGTFWAFFPTMSTSLLAGILNAPWKTNEDRQNLLDGVYNNELIEAAAALVAKTLPSLSTQEDPGRHLDAMPRRHYQGDSEHSDRLRDQLNAALADHAIAPDQNCELRALSELSYPPQHSYPRQEMNPEALDRWAAHNGRPSDWLHHSALTQRGANRLAALDRLYSGNASSSTLSRATIAEWLEALLDSGGHKPESDPPLDASAAAIQTAALIPTEVRRWSSLGKIVITVGGQRVEPDAEKVFLGGEHGWGVGLLVHPVLEADPETLRALKQLGLKPASAENAFGEYVNEAFANPWRANWDEFWKRSRAVASERAAAIIMSSGDGWRDSLKVRTLDGQWRSLFDSLLPGPIVPGDGSRDSNIAIDVQFHVEDLSLLKQLGAVDSPRDGRELSSTMSGRFTADNRVKFTQRGLPSTPRTELLNFDATTTSGPLDVLKSLSEEGTSRYTWELLDLPSTYESWTMRHDTRRDVYPFMECESPALDLLRLHGRIATDAGIRKISDGLGNPAQDRAVLRKLLSHPKADRIRGVFDLDEQLGILADPIGEDLPVPLVDEWPGLEPDLSPEQKDLQLVRCDGFRMFDSVEGELDCIIRDGFVYVVRQDDEEWELRRVLQELGLNLGDDRIRWILLRLTQEGVQLARDDVRRHTTDEERLLEAVGRRELLGRLPMGLFVMLLKEHGESLPGIEAAKAAISIFHTSALREYRNALDHLDPPKRWAGSQRAVAFVRSLGFGDEWAGERNARRDPYVDVDGPYTLPDLHDYQRRVVENVRRLINSNGGFGERRGMISMPTGSGKTRVAVQSVVEAIREDGFRGGILWVADRDELCEQAVEAWRQVWSSEGTQAERIRISRMWAGQPQPMLTGDVNVIVATIQTLSAKIARQPDSYEFLADFKLLVFDEAHRSVAPTFTSVMAELGLTRWRSPQEPFLLGLTATPYRGHDERETDRLVRRYSRNRLDEGAFASDDPEVVIRELQGMRVLARAYHDTIEGGSFELSDDERRQSRETPWLPRSVENRIAGDAERTGRIIEAYKQHIDRDWPTLIFATSVEHSQTVAALLTSEGIKARAVSAETETSVRRRIVEDFRAGEIKALVNYGIFREGFDAPKTRAIVVARPVYSPNLYFQMIGRGLRGVKNGGNDRCLILNVRDNIENFQRKLAFSDLDWLWD